MSKDKLDEIIRNQTQGPSIGKAVSGAALIGVVVGVAKALGCIFKTK